MPSAMLLRVGFPADVEGEDAGRLTASPRRSEMIAAGEAGCGESLTSSRPFQMMMGDATSPLSIGGGRDGDVGVVEDVVAGPITAGPPPGVDSDADMLNRTKTLARCSRLCVLKEDASGPSPSYLT